MQRDLTEEAPSTLRPGQAAIAGAAMGTVLLFVLWLMLRERDETVGGLVQFWLRVPGEFLLGVLPLSGVAALFGWLAALARSAAERQGQAE